MADDLFHPWPNLLAMSCDEILTAYRHSQLTDILSALDRLGRGKSTLIADIEILDRYFAAFPSEILQHRLQLNVIQDLFRELHDHVMKHPVWTHPVFRRFVDGQVTYDQLRIFAQHYFNQVKNTRQCVALALGRFHSLLPYATETPIGVILSELTQMVLARLLADEYGFAKQPSLTECDGIAGEDGIGMEIDALFKAVTHPELYRRFLSALGIVVSDYDVPLLHSVADNVLVQRIVSGDSEFDHLEALASVGLGMEWGVPAFFSMLMSGIIKVFRNEGIPLDTRSMEIWSAHVQQDVLHGVAVMLVTSFFVENRGDIERVKGITNALMAFRYEMMSDIYDEVFGGPCARIDQIQLHSAYWLQDDRLKNKLLFARMGLRPLSVRDYSLYRSQKRFPMITLAGSEEAKWNSGQHVGVRLRDRT